MTITTAELIAMENRRKGMDQEDALRAYRRSIGKPAIPGSTSKSGTKTAMKPGQHPLSRRSQEMVAEVKSGAASASLARQRAIDAFKKDAETEAADIKARIMRLGAPLVDEGEEVQTTAPAKPEKHLILKQAGKSYLMAVTEFGGDIIFAQVVGPNGDKVPGTPITRLTYSKNRKTIEIFASLSDALEWARTNGVSLAG